MCATQLDRILADLQASHPGIEASAVISATGVLLASALLPGMDEDSVSAVSAAILSLGVRALEELLYGNFEQLLVTGTRGQVLMTATGNDALIAVLVSTDTALEPVLEKMHIAALRVRDSLERQHQHDDVV